ncbi:cysteine--tRNA ligase [Rhizobium sp. SGZ-381]|uniref:cysteine--tRNA ligase n=1 Tax=Rhizobium sp. SGZ-381 TaxID=3342800 RepID=UPI00366DA04B
MSMSDTLKLYNTLTREKSDFQPIDPDNVRLYVCGPTVYDFAHIGNARPVIVFDVLYRLLRHVYGEDHVTYVRNITDVDDKINARALRDFGQNIADGSMSLNEAIRAVTGTTESQFKADVARLGCLAPTHEPRATENIAQMIAIIQRLLTQGHAYVAKGSEGHEVLFATASMADYGQLSKRRMEDQQAGARVAVEAHKTNPGDFVLWKQSADTEPGWTAEFTFEGETFAIYGRPGWHIECSAMADRYLWEEIKDRLSPKGKALPHQFDIHGGGLDLIFPHHENEIAQSCCAFDTDVMASVWMHNGFVQVEGRKMSKSDGNFVTINELLETEKFGGQRWHGHVLKLAMLMTHYRQPIDWTADRLFETRTMLYDWHRQCFAAPMQPVPQALLTALMDDLNTSAAIAVLHTLSKAVRTAASGAEQATAAGELRAALAFLGIYEETDSGTLLAQTVVDRVLENEVKVAVAARLELLKAKNFAEADKIRDELLAQGIQLKDGKDPATGERVTTWEMKR